MKCVILAGGLGTRLSEQTIVVPKPMVDISGRPIIWHIMKIYSRYGINQFIICLGYKGFLIKEYFSNYGLHQSDVTIDLKSGSTTIHENTTEPWTVTLVDTGMESMTGGRLRRIKKYLGDSTFCMTYGDGLSDVNISKQITFHKEKKKLATVTAVQPPGRFGSIDFDLKTGDVSAFLEKPKGDGGYINGGFFVLEPAVLDLISGDDSIWEQYPMKTLAEKGQMNAFVHSGFWHAMDTLRDKQYLEGLAASGKAPWLQK